MAMDLPAAGPVPQASSPRQAPSWWTWMQHRLKDPAALEMQDRQAKSEWPTAAMATDRR
jgi:hypothetical protein